MDYFDKFADGTDDEQQFISHLDTELMGPIMEKYQRFNEAIDAIGLSKVHLVRPLLAY